MTLIRRACQVDDGLFPVSKFTAEDWQRQRWGYYRMVEKVDGEIAKVLDAIREAEIDDNTLVIFTSDHGDCTGAHRFNQKTVFYEESARIPLIISWQGTTPPATSDQLVNIGVDILPTMLDAAGIERPSVLKGRNLLPSVLGKPVAEGRDYIVVQNHLAQTGQIDGIRPTMQGRMVRSERFKYCLYSRGQRREALYDLEDDPLEQVNLAYQRQFQATVLEHRNKLAEFAAEHGDKLAQEMLANDVEPRPFAACD
jgi:choline-sulfatase